FVRRDLREVLLPAPRTLFDRDGDPVSVQDPIRRNPGDHVSRRHDPHQVERVGPAHGHELAAWLLAPHAAQQPHRFRQRVLLPREPTHEAPAANLSSRLASRRNTTPYRRSSCHATASATASSGSGTAGRRTRDQRPEVSTPNGATCPRRRNPP